MRPDEALIWWLDKEGPDCASDVEAEGRSLFVDMAAAVDEIERLRLQVAENAEFSDYWRTEAQEARDALKPFAKLAGKLNAAPNLVGLLTEDDFRRAAEAYGDTS